MTTLVIPLRPLPSQTLAVILGDQQIVLTLRQLATGLFINVVVDNEEVVGLVICQNMNRIVRDAYLGLQGDLVFYDASGGRSDPHYAELGTRFQLVWMDSATLEELES